MHFCCTFCFVFMKPTFFIAVPYVESENSTNVVTLLNIHIQWVSIATALLICECVRLCNKAAGTSPLSY